ncbi:2-oxodicarboxylate carrier 2 [Monoraphidium neglectum]|uniref:2-oxodicarboxylate carrier 2 n=1 Tax=Monoraphidium neglectum TaxID=145388 RepID=A0A0D2LXB0_9CHLO|nr:2-oxodicarboxylate carrier 2 [Monoraphidium neglectum]KIY96069.1 2-oxodicarboxylate carrier 2 [Monoraphidium neglectum]|eukprot:XP_013895089.1 2-oxodicarboxylate carrier 2 [Monoraphidium neglectum]
MLKTRFQINPGQHLKLLPTIREIIAEGGVSQLYRGEQSPPRQRRGLPEILGLMPRASAAMSTLEFSRRFFRERSGGELPARYAYASGALSGVSEGVVFAPFQVIKVRLMAKEHLGRYANTLDCLGQVLRQEGPAALFIGIAPTLWRNCLWNGVYYGTTHELDRVMPELCNPWVAAGRQLASQLPGERRYTRVFPTLATIWREEGPTALYKGFVPKALRLGIGQSVGLLTFQEALKAFGAAHTPADDAREARAAALISE